MKNQEHNSDTLIKVEGVSKKFCLSLKKSLWYGLQDMGRELTGRRHGVAGADQRLKAKDHRPILPSSDPQPPASSLQPSVSSSPSVISPLQPSAFSPQPSASDAGLRPKEFWAVNDVSFELKRGECLGLIGRNGAGKTTLLKMLNGLIKPDAGRIEMRGRVGALIALGAGFNPILTGRENIYTNASVLGLSKKETDAKLDEIIDFAEIGDFLDTPVQNYSSGMGVRLGFAVAAVLIKPDILLLDEVLAVGDIGFVIKCLSAVREMSAHSAVILVSHNMQYVSSFCSRVILMEHGECTLDAREPADAIDRYFEMIQHETSVAGTGGARVCSLHFLHCKGTGEIPVIRQGVEAYLILAFEVDPAIQHTQVCLYIMDESMSPVACFPVVDDQGNARIFPGGSHQIKVGLGAMEFCAGKYNFVVAISDVDTKTTLNRSQGLNVFRIFADKVNWGRLVRPVKACL